MEIRLCRQEETEEVKKIWQYCFDDGPEYVDFYFKHKFRPENTLVVDSGKGVISSLHLNQHRISLRGKEFNTSYVVGVSTLPEARGLGMMGKVMQESFKEMEKRGQEICILMPIDFRLYTRYGYSNCYNMLKVNMDVFALKKFKLRGEFRRPEKAEDLLEVYSDAMKRFNGYSKRDLSYFEDYIIEMEAEGGYIYVNYREDQPVGYLVYSILDGKMIVRETYSKDLKSYSSILKFIFNHNTQCSKVELYLEEDSVLVELIDNPREAKFEVSPFMMGRIVDFENLIKKLSLKYNGKETYLRIEDSNIEKNNGVFRLYSNQGYLDIERAKERECDRMDISRLSALVFGHLSVEKIEYLEEVEFKDSEILRAMFGGKLKTNHINEYV